MMEGNYDTIQKTGNVATRSLKKNEKTKIEL